MSPLKDAPPTGGPWLAGASATASLANLRPLAAGSARRNLFLAPQAALRNPPHRPGSPVAGVLPTGRTMEAEQAEGGGRSEVKRRRAGPLHAEPRTEPPPRPRSLFRRPRNEAADSAPVARKEEFSGTSLFLPKPRGVSPVECLPFHREMFGFPGRVRRPARGWWRDSLPKNDSPRKGLPPSRRGYGGRRAAPSPNGMAPASW